MWDRSTLMFKSSARTKAHVYHLCFLKLPLDVNEVQTQDTYSDRHGKAHEQMS